MVVKTVHEAETFLQSLGTDTMDSRLITKESEESRTEDNENEKARKLRRELLVLH